MLLHHKLITALIAGDAWTLLAQGLAWSVAELVAPRWVLDWRQRLTAEPPNWRKPVEDYFSEKVLSANSWTSPQSQRKVRLLGVGLIGGWLTIGVLLIWIPNYADSHFFTF